MVPDFIYLARGRPQRPRANLIQTLHTVEALSAAGCATRLYLPPLPRRFDLPEFLAGMGLRHPIDLRAVQSLHGRWRGWPFMLLHRRELLRAAVVYTRVPDFSLRLAAVGVPHLLEVHDSEPLEQSGELGRLAELARRGLIRGFVSVSEAGRQALLAQGAPPQLTHTVPNGVDLEAFASLPLPAREDIAAGRAIYVGRVSRDRGLPLFEAVAAAGVPMRVVGPRDHEPDRPHPLLELQGAVPHAGVPAQLAQGAIALMPYQADLRHAASISPIKLFEAMAAGRPVIASDLPPIRELVRDGENGLLVPPDDRAAWLAAIARLRADPDAALAMARQARSSVSGYGWGARAQRLLAIAGRLRAGAGAGAP